MKRVVATLVFLIALVACGGQTQPASQPASQPAATPTPAIARDVPAIGAGPAAAPSPTPIAVKLLKVEPSKGNSGDTFAISGDGLPAGKSVEFAWVTANGSYDTVASAENIEFHDKKFVDKRISLGSATADAQGHLSASFKVPDDYGETHDIMGVVDGKDIAKGGYRIMRSISISPASGPIGTPITIKVSGLGWKTYESTIDVRYDNNAVGIGTGVTTHGTANIVIRAAGHSGKHIIDIDAGAKSVPYLNNQQSGTAYISDARFEFNLTDDTQLPVDSVDFPDPSRVAALSSAVPRTASAAGSLNAPLKPLAAFEPATGPILSKPVLRANNLPPNADIDVYWVTARGNRVSPSGWSLNDTQIATVKTDANGLLAAPVEIPDDLGGWHSVKLLQGQTLLAEVPFYVERSIVAVTPQRVKAGEIFSVHIKGVGWTELDNGVAVTYDNSYIGFACGFSSNGDVTMMLSATGGPGIHLLDLYPMIYQGHGNPPWGYQEPFLSYNQDFPGLALGYKLPAIRLAIEVVP